MSEKQTAANHQQRTMKAAFDALLEGDTTKRDSLMEDMERARLIDARERALQRLKDVDFFVRADGVAMRSGDIKRVAQ